MSPFLFPSSTTNSPRNLQKKEESGRMIHRKWSLLTGPVAILGGIVGAVVAANYLFIENFLAGIRSHYNCFATYPVDTIHRRMMMTSGEAVKYKGSLDAFNQISKKEGVKSLCKGAEANILHAVASAGVLAWYDQLQLILFRKKYGSGGSG